MAMNGMGIHAIGRTLTAEKVEKPSAYFARTSNKTYHRNWGDPYFWSDSVVRDILEKLEYLGHTVNFRWYKQSFKDKANKKNSKEDWKIFENTHEPLIDQETFDTVQRLRKTVRRTDTLGAAKPLTGLVFCANCGRKLWNHRHAKDYIEFKVNGKVKRQKTADHYSCSRYRNAQKQFDKQCTPHYIRTVVLEGLILDMIRRISEYVRCNQAEFVEKIRETSLIQQEDTAKEYKRLFSKNERRISELDVLFKKVFESNANGKLSDERFEQLSADYENEQRELKSQNTELQVQLDSFQEDSLKSDRFIELVKRYTDFEVLTPIMLNEFVEKIIVHEADKSSGSREQLVEIYFNFIGNFDIPQEEIMLSPEEQLAEEERTKKIMKQREYGKRYREKQKAKNKKTA
jgi:hypothetical protein